MNRNHSSKNEDCIESKQLHCNYACVVGYSNAFYSSNVNEIDLSKDMLNHYSVIKSQQSHQMSPKAASWRIYILMMILPVVIVLT